MADDPTQDTEDLARLIQEALSELGHAADPKTVAARVVGLNRGLPAEDEFSVICSWLGQTNLIHKLDQLQVPLSSRDTFQVPDLLATFKTAGPFLIEVKACKDQTLSFRSDYLAKLNAYAQLLSCPLLIAWKFHSMWSLFDARHLRLARVNFNISHAEAMRQNVLGVLAGDIAFALGPKSGVHFKCAKEELLQVDDESEGRHTRFTELWRMRITDAYFTDGGGRRRDDLHQETKQIFAGWDLQQEEVHFPDHVLLSFVPGANQFQFAHTALVHLLSWERPSGHPQNWRHLLKAPTVVRSIADFRAALDRALEENVVMYVLHQRPVDRSDFLPRRD